MRLLDIFENDLPMDEYSRLARAKKLGFTYPAYHGSNQSFNEFSLDKGNPRPGGGHAPNFSDNPKEAGGYAEKQSTGGNVVPVLLRINNPFNASLEKRYTAKEFKDFLGDIEPWFELDRYSGRDVLDAVYKHFRGDDRRRAWSQVYRWFEENGYDGLIFPNTPRDHMGRETKNTEHTKIIVFDPKNVRSKYARFDPEKSNSSDISA